MSMESYTETQRVSTPIPIPGTKRTFACVDPDSIFDNAEFDDDTIRPGTLRYKRMKYVMAEHETAVKHCMEEDPWWKEMDDKFNKLIKEIDEGFEKIDKIYNKVFKKNDE